MVTEGAQAQQLTGCGELWQGDSSRVLAVTYRLDLSPDGTVKGTITAPPLERLPVSAGGPMSLPVLKVSSGRLVAFEVRVYEPRPGGSAQIAGCLLRSAVEVTTPAAA